MTTAAAPESEVTRWCTVCRSAYRADFARCPIDGGVLAVSSDDPLIGSAVGQYVIESFLGEGAMSRVYRAHHALLENKLFALKVMLGDRAATMEMRLRFAQEADAASKLQHPNVVSVVDYGKTDAGLIFLAMELVEGETLSKIIDREAPIAANRALGIARQICMGLAHAHERGLVHRDLKPDNILVSAGDRVRIVDFGLAIPADDEVSTRLTGVGLVVGTPVYAAPEQVIGDVVDYRADLFALGVTLYEMLAGKLPYEGNLVELIRQNASDIVTPIAQRTGAVVPPEVEDIARKLMRRSREDRFASAQEVIAAIDSFTEAAQTVVTLPIMPTTIVRRSKWVAASAVLTLVAAIAIVWAVATKHETTGKVAQNEQPRHPELPTPLSTVPTPKSTPPVTPTTPSVPSTTSASVDHPSTGSASDSSSGSASVEPVHTDPSKPDPTKLAPAKPDPAISQSSTSEPVKPDTGKLVPGTQQAGPLEPRTKEPGKTEPAKTEPGEAESAKTEPAKTEPAKTEAAKTEPAKTAPAKSEPGKTEISKTEPASTEPTKTTKTEPGKPDPAKLETVKTQPVPSRPATPLWTTATVRIADIRVRGSVPEADVRRAIERGVAAMKACYQRTSSARGSSPAATVRVTLSFDDSRRATGVSSIAPGWDALASCVTTAAEALRIQEAPDVGTVAVTVDLAFTPVSP